jgi:vesicle coat complex subunit
MEIERQRASEFLECLGNGKTIYECEMENDFIDELMEEYENEQ